MYYNTNQHYLQNASVSRRNQKGLQHMQLGHVRSRMCPTTRARQFMTDILPRPLTRLSHEGHHRPTHIAMAGLVGYASSDEDEDIEQSIPLPVSSTVEISKQAQSSCSDQDSRLHLHQTRPRPRRVRRRAQKVTTTLHHHPSTLQPNKFIDNLIQKPKTHQRMLKSLPRNRNCSHRHSRRIKHPWLAHRGPQRVPGP